MIDAHFHMQDPSCEIKKWIMKDRFDSLTLELKEHNITQINAIYWPYKVNIWHSNDCKKLGDELKDEYKDKLRLNTGIQFFIKDKIWENIDFNDEPSLDFIKLHGDMLSDENNQKLSEFLDFFIKKDINKFQFHTGYLTDKEINKLEPYIARGIKFFLVHGAETLKKEVDISRLQSLKGNLFLGTSSHKCFTTQIGYVKEAIDKGLSELVCFETDANIAEPLSEYNNYLEAIKKIVPLGSRIYNENAKEFL